MNLFQVNFHTLYQEVTLKHWNDLKFSLFDRVTLIRLMILPRFLYLFRTLPIRIPDYVFSRWHNTILDFVWEYKKHSLAAQILYNSTKTGGLDLPMLHNYYIAAV